MPCGVSPGRHAGPESWDRVRHTQVAEGPGGVRLVKVTPTGVTIFFSLHDRVLALTKQVPYAVSPLAQGAVGAEGHRPAWHV